MGGRRRLLAGVDSARAESAVDPSKALTSTVVTEDGDSQTARGRARTEDEPERTPPGVDPRARPRRGRRARRVDGDRRVDPAAGAVEAGLYGCVTRIDTLPVVPP